MNRSQLIEHLCRHGGIFGLLKQNYRRKGRLPILRGLTGVRIKALSPSTAAAPHGMTQSCEIIIMPLREGRQYDVLQSTAVKNAMFIEHKRTFPIELRNVIVAQKASRSRNPVNVAQAFSRPEPHPTLPLYRHVRVNMVSPPGAAIVVGNEM